MPGGVSRSDTAPWMRRLAAVEHQPRRRQHICTTVDVHPRWRLFSRRDMRSCLAGAVDKRMSETLCIATQPHTFAVQTCLTMVQTRARATKNPASRRDTCRCLNLMRLCHFPLMASVRRRTSSSVAVPARALSTRGASAGTATRATRSTTSSSARGGCGRRSSQRRTSVPLCQ